MSQGVREKIIITSQGVLYIKDNDYVPGVYIMSCHGGWILIDSKGGS